MSDQHGHWVVGPRVFIPGSPEDDALDRGWGEVSGFPSETGSDRLAQIEEWVGNGNFAPRDDVLALVEIARAARETGWKDLNGLCWCEQSQELTGKPHRPQCQRMRDALASLDSGAAE